MRQICRRAIQQRLLGRKVLPPTWEVPRSQSSGRRGCFGAVAGLQRSSRILWGTVRGRTARPEAPWSYPARLFSDCKAGVLPAAWLAAEEAAVCGALGALGVHMQVITGCWDAARPLRTLWVVPRAKTTAQDQEVTIPGIGESFFRGFVPSVAS